MERFFFFFRFSTCKAIDTWENNWEAEAALMGVCYRVSCQKTRIELEKNWNPARSRLLHRLGTLDSDSSTWGTQVYALILSRQLTRTHKYAHCRNILSVCVCEHSWPYWLGAGINPIWAILQVIRHQWHAKVFRLLLSSVPKLCYVGIIHL